MVEKSNGINLQECPLPARTKEVAIFVDAQTQSIATRCDNYDGGTSVFLTKIYLDHLGFVNNLVRSCGLLSSIYIRNIESINGSFGVNSVSVNGV